MATKSPEEICRLFQRYIREADISVGLALFDFTVLLHPEMISLIAPQ